MSAWMKLSSNPEAVAGFKAMGYPDGAVFKLGIVELLATILYVVPATSVLGAILLTGYLGGAVERPCARRRRPRQNPHAGDPRRHRLGRPLPPRPSPPRPAAAEALSSPRPTTRARRFSCSRVASVAPGPDTTPRCCVMPAVIMNCPHDSAVAAPAPTARPRPISIDDSRHGTGLALRPGHDPHRPVPRHPHCCTRPLACDSKPGRHTSNGPMAATEDRHRRRRPSDATEGTTSPGEADRGRRHRHRERGTTAVPSPEEARLHPGDAGDQPGPARAAPSTEHALAAPDPKHFWGPCLAEPVCQPGEATQGCNACELRPRAARSWASTPATRTAPPPRSC